MKLLRAEKVSSEDMKFQMTRVYLGPLVVYRYAATLNERGLAWWMFHVGPGGGPSFGFGGHLPSFLNIDRRVNRWVDSFAVDYDKEGGDRGLREEGCETGAVRRDSFESAKLTTGEFNEP